MRGIELLDHFFSSRLHELAGVPGCPDMTASILEHYDARRNDCRTTDEWITAALIAPDRDEEGYWDVIGALHWRGSEELLNRAARLCQSYCPVERRVGADILAQLRVMERSFPKQCVDILLAMLRNEERPEVLDSILMALGHHCEPDAIRFVSPFRHHPHPGVRYAVVHALSGFDDPLALVALVELTHDEDSHVRDWATFGLGQQVDVDTPFLRDALFERLSDPDDDTRAEALIGLARRGDRRVVPALRNELRSEYVGTLAVESAALIADSQLYPALVELQAWWDVDPDLLQDAVFRSTPQPDGA
jgi:HEAT repeat protein